MQLAYSLAFPVGVTVRSAGATVVVPTPIMRGPGFGVSILHGMVNLPIEEFFATSVNPNLRGHRLKLRHQLFHITCHMFAFLIRIFEPWNKLPPEIVDAGSEEIFKLRFDGV